MRWSELSSKELADVILECRVMKAKKLLKLIKAYPTNTSCRTLCKYLEKKTIHLFVAFHETFGLINYLEIQLQRKMLERTLQLPNMVQKLYLVKIHLHF